MLADSYNVVLAAFGDDFPSSIQIQKVGKYENSAANDCSVIAITGSVN
ncbi:MAG: hypothetical protein M1515_01005 [Candidatus Thermoplasmatota archaeon]|jgi:hypothetical protein|nr:hypothetical protein [Candidatus Thermoplasmatota archaeon]